MTTLFENNDFRLLSTGHDYDFVGIIETKTENPLTFFFDETLTPSDEEDEDCEWEVDESQTELKAVFENMPDDADVVQETAFDLSATSWLRTRDDKSTGFLSDCLERGWFLALIKNYCPDKLKEIAWA